jgi:hypothetical protein
MRTPRRSMGVLRFWMKKTVVLLCKGALSALVLADPGCGPPPLPPGSAEPPPNADEAGSAAAGSEGACDEFEQYLGKYFPDDTSNLGASGESIAVSPATRIIPAAEAHLSYPVSCNGDASPDDGPEESSPCVADYFPPLALGFHVKAKAICPHAPSEWWVVESTATEQLEAWHEPSLQPGPAAGVETYRFVYAPPGEASTLIRLEKNPDGYFLMTKYCSCNQARERETFVVFKALSPEHWERFEALIKKARFWNAAAQVNRIMRDSTLWMLEGRDQERYHLVTRSSPDNGYFRKAGEYLMALADIKDRDVYCCIMNAIR